MLLLSSLLFGIGIYFISRTVIDIVWYRKKSKSKTEKYSDSTEFRIAVHEAGHAIAAWFCSSVFRIQSVVMDESGGGYVDYVISYNKKDERPKYWCNLVIALAGVAAEVKIYSTVRSHPARLDLAYARQLAEKLSKTESDFPWYFDAAAPTLPFEEIYETPLSNKENEILSNTYRYVSRLLLVRTKQHHKLVVYLLKHRQISEKQLCSLLGSRQLITAFGSGFLI